MKLSIPTQARKLITLQSRSARCFSRSDAFFNDKAPDDFNGSGGIKTALEQAHATDPRTVESSFPSDQKDHHIDEKEYREWLRDPTKHSFRPKIAPPKTSVLLFPGQGSQFVGMGSSLLKYPNVSKMYTIASDILGYNLLDVCTKGPKSKLDKTMYCQPAIFVASLAAIEKLRDDNPEAS